MTDDDQTMTMSSSEYTEETVHSDEVEEESEHSDHQVEEESEHSDDEVEEESEQSDADDSVNEEMNGNVETPVVPKTAESSTSPKPWIVGSRDMHKSPKEAKPWWSGGWWPDEEKAKKSEQIGDKPTGKDKELFHNHRSQQKNAYFPFMCRWNGIRSNHVFIETESRTNTAPSDGEGLSTGPMSPWSTAPDTEDGESTTVENDQSVKIENAIDKQTERR